MDTLEAIWAVVTALWNTGNRLARWAIGMILLWPLLLAVVALSGNQLLVSIIALLPVLSVLFLFLICFDPLVLVAVAAISQLGQSALRWIATIIGAELVIGIYFSAVPVANDRGLVPLLVLIPFAILFLAIGKKNKLMRIIIFILTAMIAVLTFVFSVGGRERVGGALSKRVVASTEFYPVAADAQNIQIGIGETAKVRVRPDSWAGCVRVPPNAEIDVDSPGEIEYFFWKTGKRIICKKDSPPVYFGDKREFLEFWLRGDEGEVVITASLKDG